MGSFSKLKDIILGHKSFLLICHERPDGDSIGSLLALGEALESMGKEVTMVSKDPVPTVFTFLVNALKIQQDFSLPTYDVVVLLDNGDFRRTGFAERLSHLKVKQEIHLVNIDHHPKNDIWKVALINYINPKVSSTCELVYEILGGLDIEITPSIATSLLTGIFTDTGGFQHPNTSIAVLEVASDLLNKGAKLRAITSNITNSHSVATLKLWGIALNRLTFKNEWGMAFSFLTRKDIEGVGATEDEVSGLANLINTIPESRVALLLYETVDGKIKGSLRTELDNVDLSRVAGILGGGGHRRASGFSFPGQFQKVDDSWQII